MLADLLVLTSSKSAAMVDLIKKQMASIGCPWFTAPFSGDSIRIFHMTTDAGGDVSGARRMIKRLVGEQAPPCVLFLDIDCLMHQYSLGTMDVLKGMDKMRTRCYHKLGVPQDDRVPYIATLMKVFNVWREHAACSPQSSLLERLVLSGLSCVCTPHIHKSLPRKTQMQRNAVAVRHVSDLRVVQFACQAYRLESLR